MIITESLRHDSSAAAGAAAPLTMSGDLPVRGSGDCSSGISSNVDSTPVTNGCEVGLVGISNNNNNNGNGTDFCKSGSRRKQSKPNRVSAAEAGGAVSGGHQVDNGGGYGGSDSGHFGISANDLSVCEGQPRLGAKVVDACGVVAMPAVHEESASISSGDGGSSSTDVVNYPCHQCSRTFATLLLREQHVHSEHVSEMARNVSFPTAYHRLASDLAHSASSTMAAAAAAVLPSKSRDGRSLLPTYAVQPGHMPTKSVSTAAAVTVVAAGYAPTVFHPEAYCDICQREFCNKYFLKTHRANIHGIYATDTGAGGSGSAMAGASSFGGRDRDTSVAALQLPNGLSAAGATDGQRESASELAPASAAAQRDSSGSVSGSPASFSCDICHKPFSSRLYVKKHLMNVHGVTFPPAAVAGLDLPAAATTCDRRNGWDTATAWSHSIGSSSSSAIAPMFASKQQPQHSITAAGDQSPHEAGQEAEGGGSVAIGYGSSCTSAPADRQRYGSPPQRSPLCLTMASTTAGSTAAVAGEAAAAAQIAGQSSPGDRGGRDADGGGGGGDSSSSSSGDGTSAESSSCPTADMRGRRGPSAGDGRGLGYCEAASSVVQGPGGQAIPFEAADPGSCMSHDSGHRGHGVSVTASDKSLAAAAKDLELRHMLSMGGCIDWDDGQLSRHSADSSGRRGGGGSSSGSSGVGCSPPRKRKALEALFGYGSNGFFDAAVAVRMADRIACDICGKEVCNKYFLKAHKLKMHGVADASLLQRQQRPQQQSALATEVTDDELTAAAVRRGTYAELASPMTDVGRPPSSSSSPSLSAAQATPDDSQSAVVASTGGGKEPYAGAMKAESPDDGPSVDGLLAMGIDPEAYCSICKKEFCSKYFLRTHKLNMHGIVADGKVPKLSPRGGSSSSGNMPTLSAETAAFSSAAVTAAAAALPVPGSPDGSAAAAAAAAGMVVGEIYKQWRWKEPANQTRVFCDICNKELCNKYFLRTHKLNKHGITTTTTAAMTTPEAGQTMATAGTGPYGSTIAIVPASSSRQGACGASGRDSGSDGGKSPAAAVAIGNNPASPAFQASRHDVTDVPDGAALSHSQRQMAGAGVVAATAGSPTGGAPFVGSSSGDSATTGCASAVAASSRILGLKFDLEQAPTLQAASTDSQQQLAASGSSSSSAGGGGSGLPPGYSDAWGFLHPAVSRQISVAAGTGVATSGAGGSMVPCSTCGMLLANQEELAHHGLQTGHHVTGTALDLQQSISYQALQRDGLQPDVTAMHLRHMSMAYLMSGAAAGGGGHGRVHSGKSAAASGEKLYSCSRCDYKTPWLSNIYSHEQRKHGGGAGGARGGRSTEVHTCGVCLRTFSYEHSLMRHVTEYHGGAGLPVSGQATAGSTSLFSTATTTPSTVATPAMSPAAIASRIKVERDSEAAFREADLQPPSPISRAPAHPTQKRRARCPYCSKQFINKYLCQSHIRHVHGVCTASAVRAPSVAASGDQGTMYACSVCKFTCRMLSNLRMHQAIKHKMPVPSDLSDCASSNGSGGGAGGHDGSVDSGGLQDVVKRLHNGCNNDQVSLPDDGRIGVGISACSISKPIAGEVQPILMQPFRILDISGADDFAPTTVYLPVYKKVKGEALVTFTLRSVEN